MKKLVKYGVLLSLFIDVSSLFIKNQLLKTSN